MKLGWIRGCCLPESLSGELILSQGSLPSRFLRNRTCGSQQLEGEKFEFGSVFSQINHPSTVTSGTARVPSAVDFQPPGECICGNPIPLRLPPLPQPPSFQACGKEGYSGAAELTTFPQAWAASSWSFLRLVVVCLGLVCWKSQ